MWEFIIIVPKIMVNFALSWAFSRFKPKWNTSELGFDQYMFDQIRDDTQSCNLEPSEVKRLVKNVCD